MFYTNKQRLQRMMAAIVTMMLLAIYSNFENRILPKIEMENMVSIALEYLDEKYENSDYYIKEKGVMSDLVEEDPFEKRSDNLIPSETYLLIINSKSSDDTYFNIYVNRDSKEITDDYDKLVVKRGNTYKRINDEYKKSVEDLINTASFAEHIAYLKVELMAYNEKKDVQRSKEVIDTRKLELDKEYDLKTLGDKYGRIYIEINVPEKNEEYKENISNEIKSLLDKSEVKVAKVEVLYIVNKFMK